jgi:hypothetical protein
MLAEWNPTTGKVLAATSGSGFYTELLELDVGAGTATYKGRATIPAASAEAPGVLGLTSARGSRAACLRWLEGNQYITVQNHTLAGENRRKVCLLDITGMSGSTTPVEQTVLSNSYLTDFAASEKHLGVCFDRVNREIYWLMRDAGEIMQPFYIYRATYDDPESWTKVQYVDQGVIDLMPEPTGCWSIYDGYLYMISGTGGTSMPTDGNSGGRIWRLPIY